MILGSGLVSVNALAAAFLTRLNSHVLRWLRIWGICTRNTPLVLSVLHDTEPRWILIGLFGEPREDIGEGTIAVPSGVLVDEDSPRTRVTYARHEP